MTSTLQRLWRKLIRAQNAPDNLRLYLSKAVLPKMIHHEAAPPMPSPGHKSHRNRLTTRQESYRKLRRVYKLKMIKWKRNVLNYQSHILDTPLDLPNMDEETGESFRVPADGFYIPPTVIARPSEVGKVAHWVDNYVLETMQRALHLAHPEAMEGWGLRTPEHRGDPDHHLFRTVTWSQTNSQGHSSAESQCSVVFAIQAPWVLSPMDMDSLTAMRYLFVNTKGRADPDRLLYSWERVWGKLWDECVRNDCRWFVLTTYEGWTFGVFSQGWTSVFVTNPIPYDSQEPTILQCLVHWVSSAHGLEGGFVPNEVPEPVQHGRIEIPTSEHSNTDVLSESEWDEDIGEPEREMSPFQDEKTTLSLLKPLAIPPGRYRESSPMPFTISPDSIQGWVDEVGFYRSFEGPPSDFEVSTPISGQSSLDDIAINLDDSIYSESDWSQSQTTDTDLKCSPFRGEELFVVGQPILNFHSW